MRGIRYKDETEIRAIVSYEDYLRLKKLAKSKYKITIIKERGFNAYKKRLLAKKLAIAGVFLFAIAVAAQSMFIREVEILGYESIPEEEIRLLLQEEGLYAGCFKNFDCSEIESKLYKDFEEVVWARVAYQGRYARVEIAERKDHVAKTVDKEKPCSIVADRDCYIEEILPYKGIAIRKKGDFVRKGKTIISGRVPMTSTAYGTEAEKMTEYYVHAAGTIKARVPYEIVFDMPGKITEKDIKYAAEREIRSWAKKNMPQKAQILNNSLNFRQEENIIRVYVVIEVLQYIGEEQEIVIGEHKGRIKKDSN